MAIKKYVLTIEFDDNGDNCEYLKEELISDAPIEDNTEIIYELELEDYFSAADITMLLNSEIGKAWVSGRWRDLVDNREGIWMYGS